MEQETPKPAETPSQTPVPTPAESDVITIDDFVKVKLRVGTVLQAEPMEKSKKLIKLQVDLGSETRQVLAGIKEHYAPEQLVGKQIVVVANLAPRPMMGTTSHGMLLAASDASTGSVVVISPSAQVPAGSEVR